MAEKHALCNCDAPMPANARDASTDLGEGLVTVLKAGMASAFHGAFTVAREYVPEVEQCGHNDTGVFIASYNAARREAVIR